MESNNHIEIVDSLRSLYPLQDFEEKAVMEVVAEFKLLKEKAEPKQVDDDYCCPVCHTYAKDDEGVAGEYCPNCGQHLKGEGMEQR